MENSDKSLRNAKKQAMEKLLNALEKHPLSQKDFLDKQKMQNQKKRCSIIDLYHRICKSLHIHINQ
jgi:vacuolar-type H+-ATPase subunit H